MPGPGPSGTQWRRTGTTLDPDVSHALPDDGPSNAFGVAIDLYIPTGLVVTAASGATVQSGTLDWIDQSLAARTSVTHHVTLTVNANSNRTAAIGGITESDGYDPNPTNNAAITTIHLGK